MARKSKRMALYEAIQQGQAKIAEGLKTGSLRSDAPASRAPEPDRKTPVEVEMAPARKPVRQRSSVKIKKTPSVSPKMVVTGGAILLVIAVFVVGFWLGTGRSPQDDADVKASITPEKQDSNAESETSRPGRGIGFWAGGKQEDAGKDTEPQKQTAGSGQTVVQTGRNAILIQSITSSRSDELVSIQDFYRKKGIETEIIKDKSGYASLITIAGFKKNPENKDSDGYALLQKIKRYGLQYPEATGDMKWGKKPFQGAYGYKRSK